MPRTPLLVIGRGLGREKSSCEANEGSELTQHKQKHRMLRLEIRKLKQSNKLKDLEIEAKNLIITRLSTANDYLTKTAKSEEEEVGD
jgi:hypothetical protein